MNGCFKWNVPPVSMQVNLDMKLISETSAGFFMQAQAVSVTLKVKLFVLFVMETFLHSSAIQDGEAQRVYYCHIFSMIRSYNKIFVILISCSIH